MKGKIFVQIVALLLALVMLGQTVPAEAVMLATAADNIEITTQPEAEAETSAETPETEDILSKIVGEDETRRDEDEKHFRLNDGSYIAVTYGAPVHYRDDDGKWQEIDNTLSYSANSAGQAVYTSRNAVAPVTFYGDLAEGKLLSSAYDGVSVSMYLMDNANPLPENTQATLRASGMTALQKFNREATAGELDKTGALKQADKAAKLQPQKLEASIEYKDVFPGVDLQYTAISYNIKEQIVVKSRQSAYRYSFLLKTSGLGAALNADGSVSLTDAKGAERYHIPAPYMEDAAGITSNDAAYTLTQTAEGVILTVEADAAWMNAADRAYPVVIDPTLQVNVQLDSNDYEGSALYATYVTQGSPSATHGNYARLYMGYGGLDSVKTEYGYLHFNTLPTVPTGSIVTDAYLQMYVYDYSYTTYSQLPLNLYEVTEAPSSGSYYSWIKNLNWNNKPDFDTTNVIDYATASLATEGSSIHWEITELVKKWYDEGTVNRTVAITPATGRDYDAAHCAILTTYGYHDSYFPSLIVSYRSNVGIEPYYTYNTLGAGAAGTAYIADQSGQLKVVTPLVGYASTVNPVSINLVYNSDYFADSANAAYKPPMKLGLDMTVGHGWNLDVIQKMEDYNAISGMNYKKYTDGDGTVHYFLEKSDGYFYDEDGLGLKVTETSENNYTMTDDKGNKWRFLGNFLTKVTDSDGNEIRINYDSGKLTSVTQLNNGGGTITVAEFAYSAAGAVNKITDAAENVYTLVYDSTSGALLQIKRNGTAIANYSYDQRRLIKATDYESSYSLSFEYTGGKVSKYYELAETDQTVGAQVKITYPKQEKTVYQDSGLDRTLDTEDDLRTHYLFDYAGRTVNAYTVDSDGKIIGASNAVFTGSGTTDKTNNRTLRASSIGTAAQQMYLRNTGVEFTDSYLWTTTEMSVSTAEAHTGLQSLAGTLGSSSVSGKRLTETLTAGETYTFSAYVNTSAVTAFSGNGIYLRVKDQTTDTTWKSQPLTYATSESIDGGWVQLSVTFTAETTRKYLVSVYGAPGTGTFYADDFQVEKGDTCSNYNMLQNSSMEMSTYGWTLGDDASVYTTLGAAGTAQSVRINSDPFSEGTARMHQDVTVNLPGTQTYVLSGWAVAFAVPDNVDTATDPLDDKVKQCGLRVAVYYTGGEKELHYASFNPDLTGWQFLSYTIVPKQPAKTVERIRVICTFEGNANRAYFDNISLVREAAQSMRYDDDGNLEAVTSTGLTEDVNTYSGGNLIESVTGGYGTYTYNYTYEGNEHRITSIHGYYLGQTLGHADVKGNVLSTTLKDLDNADTPVIKSSATYSGSGNLQTSLTDTAGNTTSYIYSSGTYNVMYGIPHRTTSPNGAKLYQEIDAGGRTTCIAIDKAAESSDNSDVTLAKVNYTYVNGNLTGITKTDSVSSKAMAYNLAYDAFGNMLSASVGGRTLASYTYGSKNGLLKELIYGNNDFVEYAYDNLGRAKTTTYKDSTGATKQQLSYLYDGNGQLTRVTQIRPTGTDSSETLTYHYNYDSIGRLISSRMEENGATVLQSGQTYNANNQLTKQSWTVGTGDNAASYTQTLQYDPNDGLLKKLVPGVGTALTVNRDALRRLSSLDNGKYVKTYTYRDISSAQTTNQVASLAYTDLAVELTYSYEYDSMGNIASISDPTQGQKNYSYDTQGQLLTETIGGVTYTYTYDNLGNRLSMEKKNGETVDSSHTYTYGNADWADLLTKVSIDGVEHTIEYDNIGNPLTYVDGRQFTWENGRRLAQIQNADDSVLATYTYDAASGMRLSKTVGDLVYKYYYAGDKLMRMTVSDGTVMDFIYGSAGEPYAVKYNGTVYYYILNLQGDVVRIVNAAGTSYGTYKYDAWGRTLYETTSNQLLVHNPLRYRGYVYDAETGFYYLSSRYYDPEIGRFLNADSFASTGQGVLGYNMFAYCGNNPVNGVDPSGTWTFGISLGGNITFGIGVSVSIGIYFDDCGNLDFQWSYSVPGVDDTATVGAVDAGIGVTFQYTDRKTVYDLYGPATSIGGSVGPSWYVGGDLISFSDASDTTDEFNGVQATAGIGVGFDVHVLESNTKPVKPSTAKVNNSSYQSQYSRHKIITQRQLLY